MKRNKQFHHEAIIAAATKEFTEYGFKDSSLRRIAAAAEMSASGLYKHFAGKEEMFSALVEPAYQGLMDMFYQDMVDQKRALRTGDLTCWDNSKDAKCAMAYIYDHLDAFRLIVCKSQGTKYENFLHDLAVLEEETTISFMDLLKSQGIALHDFRLPELHLLVSANVNALFQAVEHDFTKEEAMHYADTLDRFFSKAWKEFFGY